MIFNSFVYLLFYAIVLTGYFGLGGWRLRKSFLVVASFVFYGSYRPIYIFVLLVPILFDYWVALRLERIEQPSTRKLFLIASLALNLGFLGYFKYANFTLESASSVAALLGNREAGFGPLDIILPIGISFHVFQSMSYVIDTYKREQRATRSLLDFMLFVSFFPQLVAGPIVRANEFLPQLERPRNVTTQDFGWAAILITIGMFEKVVLADGILGPIADKVYRAEPAQLGGLDAWMGTLAFAGQIFFDFNGYSVCAVGSALALGFHLPWNFRFPYAAIGFSDFWQRWHISLSRWFRDYVYIPLGGNRHGSFTTLRNLFLTMFLAGLWHGAAWHFIIWGVLHAFYLVCERIAQIFGFWPKDTSTLLTKLLVAALTFICVCIAWVFFRANSFDHAILLLEQMSKLNEIGSVLTRLDRILTTLVIAGLLIGHWTLRETSLEGAIAGARASLISGLLTVMLVAIVTLGGEARGFIYFQF